MDWTTEEMWFDSRQGQGKFIFSGKFKPAVVAHPASVGTGCSVPMAKAVRKFTGTRLPLPSCCMYVHTSRMAVDISYIYTQVIRKVNTVCA